MPNLNKSVNAKDKQRRSRVGLALPATAERTPNAVVALDLVVPKAYPTTGISPTEVVAVFLKCKGVQPVGIKQGQVLRPLTMSEIAGRTVQFAVSCRPEL